MRALCHAGNGLAIPRCPSSPVARMERSVIRGRTRRCDVAPGLRCAPSGLRGSSKPPAAITSNQVDSVRQLVATGFGPRKVRLEYLSACVDRRNEDVGEAAAAHV